MEHADVVVVGGGVVGLATALELGKRGRVVVLEKEDGPAHHQTGHNSGVIHSGIYYKPGSLKAVNCRRGKGLLEAFCREHAIPFETCGKVIVALDDGERPALERIHQRGLANGVDCRPITVEELREREPHAAGVAALLVPETGIVDYRALCARLVELIARQGGAVEFNARVTAVRVEQDGVVLATSRGEWKGRAMVNCAGLQSDRVTSMTGEKAPVKIVPFRGEYWELTPEAQGFCRHLIYPVPDPAFPFLGVHFTRMVGGGVECGPNAVLAFAREGYTRTTIHPGDLLETLTYGGFWRMAARHWRPGLGEMWRSFSKAAFVRALQRLVPDLREHHLHPAPAGVRAQALAPDGALLDDFSIVQHGRVVNVLNAPSPAATSCLSIGEHVAGLVAAAL
jgi:L-2-hydroxyglutarate oxidase